jgi:hypothetical protein
VLFIAYLIDPLPTSLDHVSVLSRVRCAGAQPGRPHLCLSHLIELLQSVCNCHSIQPYSARSFTTVRPIHADSRTLQYHVFIQDEQVGNMTYPSLTPAYTSSSCRQSLHLATSSLKTSRTPPHSKRLARSPASVFTTRRPQPPCTARCRVPLSAQTLPLCFR